ncbi:MAG: cytochrome c [Gammaproteobacteria bacterium]
MTRLMLLALSLILSASLLADDSISARRQQDLRNLLTQDCGSCHGLTMKGGLGPALLPSMLRGKPAEYISAIILDGRPGTAMPAWRPLISPAEARWLASLILQEEQQ